MVLIRLFLIVAVLLTANLFMVPPDLGYGASRIGGEAYAVALGTPPRSIQGEPYVTLPPEGGSLANSTATTSVGDRLLRADLLSVSTTGGPSTSGGGGNATSTVSLSSAELLAGAIRASDVRVTATSSQESTQTRSTGAVTFGELIVGGLSYPNPAANQRVDLPGVGYVILNEQIIGGDELISTSITVRALHLYVTASGVSGLAPGSELIVGSASTGIPEVSASRPVPASVPSAPTTVAFIPISTRAPIDVSISEGDDNDDININDNLDLDNDVDDNENAAEATSGTTSAGGANVVVTVVVVFPTPTATPTP
jgi:hypothetical protein